MLPARSISENGGVGSTLGDSVRERSGERMVFICAKCGGAPELTGFAEVYEMILSDGVLFVARTPITHRYRLADRHRVLRSGDSLPGSE